MEAKEYEGWSTYVFQGGASLVAIMAVLVVLFTPIGGEDYLYLFIAVVLALLIVLIVGLASSKMTRYTLLDDRLVVRRPFRSFEVMYDDIAIVRLNYTRSDYNQYDVESKRRVKLIFSDGSRMSINLRYATDFYETLRARAKIDD